MTTLAETIAEEIFRAIEREKRINKDDLIAAVAPLVAKNEQIIAAYRKTLEDNPLRVVHIAHEMPRFGGFGMTATEVLERRKELVTKEQTAFVSSFMASLDKAIDTANLAAKVKLSDD